LPIIIIFIVVAIIISLSGSGDLLLEGFMGAGKWMLFCVGLIALALLWGWLFPGNKNMEKKEKSNTGCATLFVCGLFICLWGFTGMMDGHNFLDAVWANLKLLFIVGIVGFAIYVFAK